MTRPFVGITAMIVDPPGVRLFFDCPGCGGPLVFRGDALPSSISIPCPRCHGASTFELAQPGRALVIVAGEFDTAEEMEADLHRQGFTCS